MDAINTIGMHTFKLLFDHIAYIDKATNNLVQRAKAAMESCVLLGDSEEVSACLSQLHQLFSLQKEDILNRTVELAEEGEAIMANAKRNQQEFHSSNREFVRESSQVTREELTKCIENSSIMF